MALVQKIMNLMERTKNTWKLCVTAVGLLIVFPLALFYGGKMFNEYRFSLLPNMCRPEDAVFSEVDMGTPSDLLPMGLAWGDFNNDGWDDLFVASHAGFFDEHPTPSRLYVNKKGALADTTEDVRLPLNLYASSAYFADYDNDGWLDLFVIEIQKNGIPTPERPLVAKVRVFQNQKGSFYDVSEKIGFSDTAFESQVGGMTFADFDNDRRLDIAMSFYGQFEYYKLKRRPNASILKPGTKYGVGTVKALCETGDIENALKEDPSLASKIEKDFGTEKFLKKSGCLYIDNSSRAGSPEPLHSLISVNAVTPGEFRIFQNVNGKFQEKMAVKASREGFPKGGGLTVLAGPWEFISGNFYQPVPLDVDDDGDLDIFASADFSRNIILKNRGGLDFQDTALAEYYGGRMGTVFGDFERSGNPSLAVTNYGRAFIFHKKSGKLVLDANQSPNRFGLGWGLGFLDADNDGWTDLYITNGGGFIRNPGKLNKDKFYRNREGVFADTTDTDICTDNTFTRPIAIADINNDGYEDLALGSSDFHDNKGVIFFLNKGDKNHFVKVRLRGTRSNMNGIGALISVRSAGDGEQAQYVLAGEGFYGQNSLTKIFGLGANTAPVQIKVLWPSGIVQVVKNIEINQTITIEEPRN